MLDQVVLTDRWFAPVKKNSTADPCSELYLSLSAEELGVSERVEGTPGLLNVKNRAESIDEPPPSPPPPPPLPPQSYAPFTPPSAKRLRSSTLTSTPPDAPDEDEARAIEKVAQMVRDAQTVALVNQEMMEKMQQMVREAQTAAEKTQQTQAHIQEQLEELKQFTEPLAGEVLTGLFDPSSSLPPVQLPSPGWAAAQVQ